MRGAMILGMAMAVLAPSARADWQYTRWGMTPEQVAAASGGSVTVTPLAERRVLEAANMTDGASGTFRMGDLSLAVTFGFSADTGGLICVSYLGGAGPEADALTSALTAEYGKPQKESGLPVIGLRTLSWSGDDDIDLTLTEGQRAWVLHCMPDSADPAGN